MRLFRWRAPKQEKRTRKNGQQQLGMSLKYVNCEYFFEVRGMERCDSRNQLYF